jgi:beta-glucosidase
LVKESSSDIEESERTDQQSIEAFIETSRRRFLQATGAIGLAGSGIGSAMAKNGHGHGRGNGKGKRKPSKRVKRLLHDLTLEEKIGQMTQIAISNFDPSAQYESSEEVETVGDLFTEYKVGSVLSGGASPPTYDPAALQKGMNDLQRYAIEKTGVPFVYGIDAVHGNVTVDGATAYPHNLGLGATRDPQLVEQIGKLTGESVHAIGAHWNFAPTADLQRDPRWGRFYEGFSEDTYLESQMVAAEVSGMQQKSKNSVNTAATTKHFAGYSQPLNGEDRSPAQIPMRELRQRFFPSYKAGIGAGSETVMVNSGSVNGVPAHASEFLLTEVLRNQWGFEGVVISDWNDFDRMVEMHEYVPTFKDAVREGINAGVDMYMVPHQPKRFITTLHELIREGAVKRKRIDEAVCRILTYKERLGLFDDPYVDVPAKEHVGAGRDTAREAATESMTLLTNENNVLPLSSDIGNVLVAGPSTDSVRNQMGGWTLGWQGLPKDIKASPQATTVLQAIRSAVSGGTTVTHKPTGFTWKPFGEDTSSFENPDEMRAAAADADAVVLALGEGPYSEGFGDTNTLAFPAAQQRLVETVAATETPVIGVIIAGRPRGLPETMNKLDGVVMAYQPGTAAGPAVADVLFGDVNPSGKLPFSWPRSTGQLTNVYNHLPPANFGGTDLQEPLFRFGHGLSYTEFDYQDLTLSPGSYPGKHRKEPSGTLEISVTVKNTGDVVGTDVVHAYNSQSYGSVIYPDEQLMGFERVSLKPGESKRVTIEAPLSTLFTVPGDIPADTDELVIEDGKYAVSVGDLTKSFTVGSGGYTDWEVTDEQQG